MIDKKFVDEFEELLNQSLMDLMAHKGPIVYNDEGIALVQKATHEVWDAMDPFARQKLVDDAYKFAISCLQ